jgi:hypothetical protein
MNGLSDPSQQPQQGFLFVVRVEFICTQRAIYSVTILNQKPPFFVSLFLTENHGYYDNNCYT